MTCEKLLSNLEEHLSSLPDKHERIEFINKIKILLHEHSPFIREPVDCVLWIRGEDMMSNDYNPNHVAPAEKRLLRHSLEKTGFTQPIVASRTGKHYLIVDGFHRYELGKKVLKEQLNGYLPVAVINRDAQGEAERIAATIRHNRARGKHAVPAMTDIVRDLIRLGWNDQRISRELGMEEDEILRLKQLSGLAELFIQEEFSDSWTV